MVTFKSTKDTMKWEGEGTGEKGYLWEEVGYLWYDDSSIDLIKDDTEAMTDNQFFKSQHSPTPVPTEFENDIAELIESIKDTVNTFYQYHLEYSALGKWIYGRPLKDNPRTRQNEGMEPFRKYIKDLIVVKYCDDLLKKNNHIFEEICLKIEK